MSLDLGSRLARLLLGLVRLAAALPSPPAALDAAAARAAIGGIRLYQRLLSRRTGRVCLFHPSCSHRAADVLQAHGWRGGIGLVLAQLERCGAEYTLIALGDGATLLITRDGQRFATEEIAPAVRVPASR